MTIAQTTTWIENKSRAEIAPTLIGDRPVSNTKKVSGVEK